jgi:hypothetical protein
MSEFSVKFTGDQLGALKRLHAARDKDGETLESLASKVVERGLYDIDYRRKRNMRKWAADKAIKQKMADAGVTSIEELLKKLS